MIKNEQIEELRKEIYYARSKVNGIATSNDIAERLYSAGYRKVLLDTENGSCVDCIQYAPWQLVERKIEEIKSEYKQLEKENEELKAKLEARLTCDAIKGFAEREVKKARKETAKEILGMYRLEDTFSSFQAKVMEKYDVEIQND